MDGRYFANVSLQYLIENLTNNTFISLDAFRPELVLCATIVAMLLVRVVGLSRFISPFILALAGALVGLWQAAPWEYLYDKSVGGEIFTGLLVYDHLSVYFRSMLLCFLVLFVLFTRLSGIPDREDGADFYTLVFGATLGMCLMASANHLLTVFLAVEMASVPSYALAGMLKGRRLSSEAALKYAVYGAGAAGVMLYGISLLSGVLGTAHLPTMAIRLSELLRPENLEAGIGADKHGVLALGGLMLTVGLAFKLSAVPFHFWCPDVFEGASAEVNAFLSVASKAAALALLIRVAVGLGYSADHDALSPTNSQPLVVAGMFSVADDPPVAENKTASVANLGATKSVSTQSESAEVTTESVSETSSSMTAQQRNKALQPVRTYIATLIAFIAAITCTFGNLAAYGQTNIKRLLAYSTIAHAGYMMMPVAAAISLLDGNLLDAQIAIAAVAFYIGIYLFMNLGAFAIVAFLRNDMRSEEIADYAGLIRQCPGVVICMGIILLSLLGLPPLGGFIAKFAAFVAVAEAQMWWLLVIGGLNTAISVFYYVRVLKVMVFDPEPDTRGPVNVSLFGSLPGAFIFAITLPVALIIIRPGLLVDLADAAAKILM